MGEMTPLIIDAEKKDTPRVVNLGKSSNFLGENAIATAHSKNIKISSDYTSG